MTLEYITKLKRLRRKREDAELLLSVAMQEYLGCQAHCDHKTLDGYRVTPRTDGSCPICLTPLK